MDVLSAELASVNETSASTANGGHLWVQGSFPDDRRGGFVKVFVNGSLLSGTLHDEASHYFDFPLALHAGDIIVVRASSPFVNRYVRFAYVANDHANPFVGDTHNTTIHMVGESDAPTNDPAVGEATSRGNYPGPPREEWLKQGLPDQATPIRLPEKNVTYDIIFKVPPSAP
jgi:hypothetical protein